MRIALVVDNPYRDLPGLVLLAIYLCQYGATCHLVPTNLRNSELWALTPDFVLLHYLRVNNQELARHLMNAGIKVGVLDTEGGILASMESYANSLAPDQAVRNRVSFYFSWGRKLAGYVQEQKLYSNKQVVITGVPRFDFYSDPWRQALMEIPHCSDNYPKPMVLINGNFSLANPCFNSPEQEIDILVSKFGYNRDQILSRQKIQRQTMLGITKLANNLAARFPEITFIYRPHPFERIDTYSDLLKEENLHLIRTGTVDNWILRSRAVIQKSCSTAVEAGLAGIPTLSPLWVPTMVKMQASESVSIDCKSEKELSKALNDALDGQLDIYSLKGSELHQVVGDWFFKIDGKAHQRIGNAIVRCIKNTPGNVSDSYCRNALYGLYDRESPWYRRIKGRIAKNLGLSIHWSFRQWRNIVGELPWDKSEKQFTTEQVQLLAGVIHTAARGSGKNWHKTGVQPAQQRKDYKFGYLQGRSVTVFPD